MNRTHTRTPRLILALQLILLGALAASLFVVTYDRGYDDGMLRVVDMVCEAAGHDRYDSQAGECVERDREATP